MLGPLSLQPFKFNFWFWLAWCLFREGPWKRCLHRYNSFFIYSLFCLSVYPLICSFIYSFILFMHVFIDLSIYLSLCLSIYGIIYLSMCVYTSHCLSASLHRIYLPAYPFLSVCPPASLPVCLCACLPPCVPACLSACLPASLPPCLPACLPICPSRLLYQCI